MPAPLARLLAPLRQLAARARRRNDPWERLDRSPPLIEFGPGARHEFAHYLEGTSSVSVTCLDELQDWLLGCEYVTDEALFHEDDFWQHPATFERLRAGDCEDFALWTWRKLRELDIDGDFVVGRCRARGASPVRHAWITLRMNGVEYLFEPAAGDRARMMQPLDVVRDLYLPQIGADRNARRFAYRGYLSSDTWGR